ncbi:MAG: hypothetical protein Q4G38_02585 [Aeriscardovia aeriphila]|nr:hypothetical protein [Aeriscardovia aeriphila]
MLIEEDKELAHILSPYWTEEEAGEYYDYFNHGEDFLATFWAAVLLDKYEITVSPRLFEYITNVGMDERDLDSKLYKRMQRRQQNADG